MEGEYRLPSHWRIITYISCVALIALSVFLILQISQEQFKWVDILFGVVAFGFSFLAYYAFQDARVGRLIIGEDFVSLTGPFRTHKLVFAEIKGYRRIENYIVIEPDVKTKKKIKISTYLAGQDQIQEFLYNNFADLDLVDSMREHAEIMDNEEFGYIEETRLQSLRMLQKVARVTNGLSWLVTLWVLLYPKPYSVAISAGLLYPLIALALCYIYRGQLRGGDDDKSAYPSVAQSFIVPGVAVAFRGLRDVNIIDYTSGWLPIVIITLGLAVLYNIPTEGFRPKKAGGYIFLALTPLFTFFYSLGLVTSINWLADTSEAEKFETVVVKKYRTSGKTPTYNVVLQKWEGLSENEEVHVAYDEFERTHINDKAIVYQHAGYFKMKWVQIDIVNSAD